MIRRRNEEEHVLFSFTFGGLMAVALTPFLLALPSIFSSRHSSILPYSSRRSITIKCVKVDTDTESAAATNIMCEPCNGKGWLVCDFCEGQKTNVKAPNNRIYRRCPSCKAVRYLYIYYFKKITILFIYLFAIIVAGWICVVFKLQGLQMCHFS